MMACWSIVRLGQSWINSRASFYVNRALIGACEGGFIPGTILFASYFYKSRELGSRLAVFWSTLNVARVISSLLAAATYNVIVQMGIVIGSQIYRADDQPYCYRGNKVCISICCLVLVTILAQRFWLMLPNKRKERVWQAMGLDEREECQKDVKIREIEGNRRLEFSYRF